MDSNMLYLGQYSSEHYLLQRHSAEFLSTFDLRYDILAKKRRSKQSDGHNGRSRDLQIPVYPPYNNTKKIALFVISIVRKIYYSV